MQYNLNVDEIWENANIVKDFKKKISINNFHRLINMSRLMNGCNNKAHFQRNFLIKKLKDTSVSDIHVLIIEYVYIYGKNDKPYIKCYFNF